MRRHVGIAVFLFSLAAQVSRGQQTPDLFHAIAEGHRAGEENLGVEAVKEALKGGANVNARDNAGWTPLMAAAQEGLPNVLSALVKAGADVNARSKDTKTALTIAAGCFIVRRRAQAAAQRRLPDEIRAQNLRAPAAMVRTLLRAGADVNLQQDDGRTALMNAAMMGWPESCRCCCMPTRM